MHADQGERKLEFSEELSAQAGCEPGVSGLWALALSTV